MKTSHSNAATGTAQQPCVVDYLPLVTSDQARRIARKYLLPIRIASLIVELAGIGGRAA